jgi:3'(2'), 5'-bisphosphate nucleotidase
MNLVIWAVYKSNRIFMQYFSLVSQLINISKQAGVIILQYYNDDIKFEKKLDNSPVTLADQAANDYIVAELKKLTPEVAIVSEEGDNNFSNIATSFWLVDPLDGTKSFIRRQGDFTVNIGFVENNKTIGGVIYVPVTDETYYVGADGKAYYENKNGDVKKITTAGYKDKNLKVIASHSHRNQETDDYIKKLDASEIISAASSLKFCVVACGEADIYPRFNPTMQWDTAAGHAILQAAGGSVVDANGNDFLYIMPDASVTENRYLNGSFVASGWK